MRAPPPCFHCHSVHALNAAPLQWTVTSPAYDGPSKYTCVQPTLVDGARALTHAAVPLGMSGSVSFK